MPRRGLSGGWLLGIVTNYAIDFPVVKRISTTRPDQHQALVLARRLGGNSGIGSHQVVRFRGKWDCQGIKPFRMRSFGYRQLQGAGDFATMMRRMVRRQRGLLTFAAMLNGEPRFGTPTWSDQFLFETNLD